MITSSPIEIGSDMEVTCAASTVGGPEVFPGLTPIRLVRSVRLIANKTDVLATYLPATGTHTPSLEKVNWNNCI